VWPHGRPALDSFFHHLNNISPKIQFIMEIQTGNSLLFLDVLVSRQPIGAIYHRFYWKKDLHRQIPSFPFAPLLSPKICGSQKFDHSLHLNLYSTCPCKREFPPYQIPRSQMDTLLLKSIKISSLPSFPNRNTPTASFSLPSTHIDLSSIHLGNN
jgi:hypothetical protein